MLILKRVCTNLHLPNPGKSGIALANLINPIIKQHGEEGISVGPSHSHKATTYRFFDIYQLGNKAAIQKERARITDEMNRGYFADINELKQHGGKIFTANATIIPPAEAKKFPSLEVNYSDGTFLNIPLTSQAEDGKVVVPRVSLLCLSFRAHSQAMVESWNAPFLNKFKASNDIRIYEVSLIDSWFLSLKPIRRLLLRMMQKPKVDGADNALHKQVVYAFGDHYYFRKDLKIRNLVTGYIFLLDRFGRIRWQGSGLATEEELTSLLSCTSFLLEEK